MCFSCLKPLINVDILVKLAFWKVMTSYNDSMLKNAYKWGFENWAFVNDKEMIFFNDFTNEKNVPKKLNYFIVPSTLQWTIYFGHGSEYICKQTFCKWHFL
jgi:glycosylphosphatidylinositol transamidase (GPIT) subunit GPI8